MTSLRRHVPAFLAAALLLPATAAHAQAPAPTGGVEAAPEPEIASAAAGPVSVATPAAALLKRTVRLRGQIPAGAAGRTVTVERLDDLTDTWTPVAHAQAAEDGSYIARFKPDRIGRQQLRTRVEAATDAAVAAAAPQLSVTVFRAAEATWYGPGLYGHKTACGTRLRKSTLGVAHRKLPCGTNVTIFYDGRTVTVPVIDRGPFRKGTTWDLTAATARAVGFETSDTVGALRAELAAQPSSR